jgi:putative flippase GtrA
MGKFAKHSARFAHKAHVTGFAHAVHAGRGAHLKRAVSRQDFVQFVKYFIGGTSYFWACYAIFATCYSGLHWAWWPAKMAGDAVGWTLNYLLQRYWAFTSKNLKKHEGAALAKYVLLTAFNFALDYAIVGSLKAVGVSPYIGFFVSAGFFTVWNYAWLRFWVFLGKTSASKQNMKGEL